MADLSARLKDFFAAPQTRTAASFAPLLVVAGASGLIIGAALATPAFAAAGLGLVLTSVAANITSSLVYDVVKPDLDAGERERTIAQGLKDRDPGVIRLVAEALAGGGPDVAKAIPEPTRAELIGALRQGMQEPGGALAAIAAPYTGGLDNPQTDWSALQAELRETIRKVSQTIDAAEGGVISGGKQHVEGARGPVDQVMRATGKGSRIDNSSQTAIGGIGSDRKPPAERPLDRTTPDLPDDPQHLQRLLASHTRRLEELENQAATEGLRADPAVRIEIENIRREIAGLRKLLGQ